ncbi:MAG: T9SS type A sorting domain-containing protein [candidate division Zixibacteria bacterium]|nr:T9SS type A sorting domain-containing protein [candidate division Zixibacteria bacterium]
MKCAKSLLLTALAILLGLLPCDVRADKSDFLVNDDNSAAEQDHPRIAVAGDGDFVVAWIDRRSGAADVYIQRFDPEGTPVGINRLVNDDTENAYQAEPAIAVDLTGFYSLVWKDYRNGVYPFDPDVFLQRLDSSLASVGVNQILTIELPDSLKETPDIALSPWSGGVVVWADYRNRNWDIYGQMIDAGGARTGTNFRINDDTGTAQQHAPRVAYSAQGWFAVVWYDNRLGNDDIFVQRYNSSGIKVGSNARVNSDNGTTRQAFPDVATDAAGHFTVVWVDWRNGVYPANPDIYTRKFDTTMIPVAVDAMVNKDGTRRAQREPTIAADRRGNVAIIWSDSSGTAQLFDIVGQMIDVDGVIREINFQANTETDSAQVQADVALDGRDRYVVWADKRKGNYDIYASITRYNDPTLVANPASLRFEMLAGGSLPAAQDLNVDHYGYNPLHFEVLSSCSWLRVSPGSGVTPATLSVEIATDTLAYGTHFGTLTLHDLDNDDSTLQVTVRLDVTSPILSLSKDTLDFRVFAGIDNFSTRNLTISNTGAGELVWTVEGAFDWLQVGPSAGVGGATLTFQVDGSSLSAGTTLDSVLVSAIDAVNSPTWVWLRVQAIDTQPYLVLNPDSLTLASVNPEEQSVYTVVENYGNSQLAWTAGVAAPWLRLDRTNGSDGDTVRFTVDTSGLSRGLHVTQVAFVDPGAFCDTVLLPFVLDYLQLGQDTILIADLNVAPHETDSLVISVTLVQAATDLRLPLTFDPALVTIDGVRFSSNLPSFVSGSFAVDSSRGIVTLEISSTSPDSAIAPSAFDIAWLVLTAQSGTGLFEMAEPPEPGSAAVVVTSVGARLHPAVLQGQVRVEEATVVQPEQPVALPTCYALEQNYPNPFNPSTAISFQLPKQSELLLEIFNILGQRVSLLVQGTLSVGTYNMMWDGIFDDGKPAPSGIYFYRLKTEGVSLVRKMVLIR